MHITVVVTAAGHPQWLAHVLSGLSSQADRDFDLIIAEDGDSPAIRRLVEGAAADWAAEPLHLTQPRDGFRKCRIQNRAIARAGGEYLIFLDGDCIPRSDLVATHRKLARPGRFLSGGTLRLTENVSNRITHGDIQSGNAHGYRWLRTAGMPMSRQLLRLTAPPRWAAWLDRITPTAATFNGGNASAWKTDLLQVNGFDERLGYGGLDRELGARLELSGISGIQVRHRAVTVHLYHERPYRDPKVIAANRRLWREAVAQRRIRAVRGIAELESSGQDL